MAKDYARHSVKFNRRRTVYGWYRRLGLVILLVCLVGGIAFGLYLYKNNTVDFSKKNLVSWVIQVKTLLSHKKTVSLQPTKIQPIKQDKQEFDIQFDFYTELPKMQVMLPETEQIANKSGLTKHSSSVASKALKRDEGQLLMTKNEGQNELNNAREGGQYVLQAGVFKNETAARQMQVSLLLAGFDVQIVKSVIANHIFYRIQQGPYSNITEAKIIQQQLQSKGIVSVVKKIS